MWGWIENLKSLAARKGKMRVVLVLAVGWIVLAWIYVGKGLVIAGEWMQGVICN